MHTIKYSKYKKFFDYFFSFRHIFYNPLISFIALLIFSISILFINISFLFFAHNNNVKNYLNDSSRISLYIKKSANSNEINQLTTELSKNYFISHIESISPNEGIKTLAEDMSLSNFLSGFTINPLPNVIIVYPDLQNLFNNQLSFLLEKFRGYEIVDEVKADINWIEYSLNLFKIYTNVSFVLIVISLIYTFFVIIMMSFVITNFLLIKKYIIKEALPYCNGWLCCFGNILAFLFTDKIVGFFYENGFIIQKLELIYCLFILILTILLIIISTKIYIHKYK